ncbi:phospholipase D-like domain-containing protein [Cypionkella sp.]|uniref:phospholipase D-like domain-containing protein n=1 Tax=Cypionkella sp. TaxID=2811411 RepID=UPI002AC960EC|nr:phospholipase D-like domain-containing protein [Cypionkella sp.]
MLTSHILVVLGVVMGGFAMLIVLQQRRSPQSAAAWVMFILLVPYVASLVFFAFGFRKHSARFPPIHFSQIRAVAFDPQPVAKILQAFGMPPASQDNHLSLHFMPAEARDALFRIIAQAQTRLDITLYLLDDDASGHEFVEALIERAQAGVAVRLILDRLGSLRRPKAALERLRAAGAELRYYSPFLHRLGSGHLNLRNHRKLIIADLACVWAGGRNIGNAYLAEAQDWIDLSFSLQGPAVQTYIDLFAADWDVIGSASGTLIAPDAAAGTVIAQLVPSGPDTPEDPLHDALVSAIHRAERSIWLTTPYFLPTEPLLQALGTAARRGVDVRIMLPQTSNQWVADLARGAFLRDLDEDGCLVLRLQKGMLHAKTGMIDDLAWVGSANFDVRSMLLNFESALMLYDTDSVAVLRAWFSSLEPLCAQGVVKPSPPRRFVEGLFRLGAPIL